MIVLVFSLGAAVALASFSGQDIAAAGDRDDLPETGLQGQVPLADQESGRSRLGYKRNMSLVGRNSVQNRGMNGNLAWLGDCAYVSAQYGGRHRLAGMAVIDASRPRRPRLVKVIRGLPGTRGIPIEANKKRRILVLMPFSSETPYGDAAGPSQLEIYEASGNCRNPVRVGTYHFGDVQPREFRISYDGRTIYATVLTGAGPGHGGQHAGVHDALQVIDVSNERKPRLLTTWNSNAGSTLSALGLHDLDVTRDGRRAYIAITLPAGLAIVDTTEITARKPNAQIRLISQLRWPDVDQAMGFATGDTAQLATIRGRRYILAMDETPTRTGSLCPWSYRAHHRR